MINDTATMVERVIYEFSTGHPDVKMTFRQWRAMSSLIEAAITAGMSTPAPQEREP
jgi:hypothetical protein